jgi:hypothetical protein
VLVFAKPERRRSAHVCQRTEFASTTSATRGANAHNAACRATAHVLPSPCKTLNAGRNSTWRDATSNAIFRLSNGVRTPEHNGARHWAPDQRKAGSRMHPGIVDERVRRVSTGASPNGAVAGQSKPKIAPLADRRIGKMAKNILQFQLLCDLLRMILVKLSA